MFAAIEASIAAAFAPIASGGKIVEAAGVPAMIPGISSNPDPNSTAPKVVAPGNVFTNRSIACTRNLFGSVISIDPESSMIASIFVTGVQPAEAVASGTAADAPLANAAAPSATTATSTAKTLLIDFMFFSLGTWTRRNPNTGLFGSRQPSHRDGRNPRNPRRADVCPDGVALLLCSGSLR